MGSEINGENMLLRIFRNGYKRVEGGIEEIMGWCEREVEKGGWIKGDGIIEEYEIEGEENIIICCYRRGYYREMKEKKNRYDNIMGRVKVMITDIETLEWNEYIIPEHIERVIVVGERMKRKKIIENNRRYNKISFIKIEGEKTGREIVRIIEEGERDKFYIIEEEIIEVIIENIKEIIGVNDKKIERIIGRIGIDRTDKWFDFV